MNESTIRTLLRMAYESGCDKCGGDMVLWNDIGDMKCQGCGRTGDDIESDLRRDATPDRAVVDDKRCRECGSDFPTDQIRTYFVVRDGGDEYPDTQLCDHCADEYAQDDDVEYMREEEAQPRALVALSDDRQWLVVITAGEGVTIYTKESPSIDAPYEVWDNDIEDTGQSAELVLQGWLAERAG